MDEAIRNAPRFYGNVLTGRWYCIRCNAYLEPADLMERAASYYWYVDARPKLSGIDYRAMPVCGCGKTLDYNEAE